MCYVWFESSGRRDYLGSDISSMLLTKQFFKYHVIFETGQLIIWDL